MYVYTHAGAGPSGGGGGGGGGGTGPLCPPPGSATVQCMGGISKFNSCIPEPISSYSMQSKGSCDNGSQLGTCELSIQYLMNLIACITYSDADCASDINNRHSTIWEHFQQWWTNRLAKSEAEHCCPVNSSSYKAYKYVAMLPSRLFGFVDLSISLDSTSTIFGDNQLTLQKRISACHSNCQQDIKNILSEKVSGI